MNWNFLVKRCNFSWLQNFVTGKMFANASKIITNWFWTLQPDIFKIISNLLKWLQKRAWMLYEHFTLYDIFVYAVIYPFIYLCTSVKEKKGFIKIPTLILYLKLLTSIFRRFGILKWRLLGGWVWNVASFWQELRENAICDWPLTQVY